MHPNPPMILSCLFYLLMPLSVVIDEVRLNPLSGLIPITMTPASSSVMYSAPSIGSLSSINITQPFRQTRYMTRFRASTCPWVVAVLRDDR